MKQHFFNIAFLFSGLALAQIQQGETTVNKDTDFKDESVVVERVYEPKVEAAEKIKQTPEITPEAKSKLPVSYGLKDVEAESDFETSTINADELPVKNSNPYNNYIRAGAGNRYSFLADGYAEFPIDDDKSFGASMSYYSSAADVPDITVDNNELAMNAEGFLKLKFDEADADLRVGGGVHQLNYYGLTKAQRNQADIETDDQSFKNIYVSGKYQAYNHLFLDNVTLRAGFFNDKYDAKESSFDVYSQFKNLNLLDTNWMNDLKVGAKADVNLNLSNSTFEVESDDSYRFFNVGINPQLAVVNGYLQLDLGANIQYLNRSTHEDTSDVYVFPTLTIALNTIPEFGFYGGITGGLIQNRYESFYQENPYLFTNQHLEYTRNKMEVFAGFRGDISTNFKYDASARFQQLEHIPFFAKHNHLTNNLLPRNSFSVTYDNGKKTTLEGRLNYVGISNLDLSTTLTLQDYKLDVLPDAYDKPAVQASMDANYKFLDEKLILGGQLFFVGKRKAKLLEPYVSHINANLSNSTTFSLDPYLDLNLNAHYMFLDRWAAFIEIRNILNTNYERYLDYEVQGITGIGGVMFKF
ncbi:MAG: hypothetical protein ACR2MS_03980 [Weeksellaceae bacterium]